MRSRNIAGKKKWLRKKLELRDSGSRHVDRARREPLAESAFSGSQMSNITQGEDDKNESEPIDGDQKLLEIHGLGEKSINAFAKRLAPSIRGGVGCHHNDFDFRQALLHFA